MDEWRTLARNGDARCFAAAARAGALAVYDAPALVLPRCNACATVLCKRYPHMTTVSGRNHLIRDAASCGRNKFARCVDPLRRIRSG